MSRTYCPNCTLIPEQCICEKPGATFQGIARLVVESDRATRLVKSWKEGRKEIERK